MADHGIEHLLGAILRLVRALAAGHDELLTKEQVAVKLTISVDRLDKYMHDGILPQGKVWFKPPGLPARISWTALCEHYRTVSGGGDHDEAGDDEPIPHWRHA